MPVVIRPVEDDDFYRIFSIACDAFARNEPIWDTFWPKHWTHEGRLQGAERMRNIKNSDPQAHYLKAVDDQTGEILGMCKWLVYNNQMPQKDKVTTKDGNYWETEEEKEYCGKLAALFTARRNAAIERTKGNLLSLDVLTVDPAHQRKKVGDALVKWGTEKADELGVEAVVESSVYGKGLYEKNGFVFQEDVVVQVPGEEHRPTGAFAWLVRPKKGSQ